ncbi:MAG TPA: MarR family transcriptional regulator [Phenylobacterium sp.]|uniref:MarR family winged helix-turn-helix transcriptional regulator n=1 Tax=Phenylobacterium sp. TaxID=1871053 RepID=UPI002CD8A087|nr:MarR family transcriptional regulator [Phenylobacterium sp.]HSV01740.1 MarR family transcriptional regulator [Phenylobacterium sp.]
MADRDPSQSLVGADYQAMAAFRHALRRFAAFSENAAHSVGLTPQQHQALLAIRAHIGAEPMTISELAEALLIKNHSAVGLVARLVERDLVTRNPSPLDRRRILLRPTAEAEVLLEQVVATNLRELSASAPIFRELLKTLRRLTDEPTPAKPAAATRRAPK